MTDGFRWIATEAPLAGRYDDIFFLDRDHGWAINGNSQVLRTADGARTWSEPVPLAGGAYPRCIGMADETTGWIGCISSADRLFHTRDGGRSWTPVRDLPDAAPPAVCGLQVLDERHVVAAGTNFPDRPTGFLKSTDGGETWSARAMADVAAILVDIHFKSPSDGWVVGGRATKPYPRRRDVVPVVLRTEDGGETWQDTLGPEVNPPLGEWGWKIQFVDEDFAVVACENFQAGAILISEDGGRSWRRQEIRNPSGEMVNANLEGIGFLDRRTGWVGGWGDKEVYSGRTSATVDGGRTWTDLTAIWPDPLPGLDYACPPKETRGQYINRFRFPGGVGYASGNTVYKYTDEPAFDRMAGEPAVASLLDRGAPLLFTDTAMIPVTVAEGTRSLTVEVFDRFADRVRTLVEEHDPAMGRRQLRWDLRDNAGARVATGQFLVQVTCDGRRESRLLFRDRRSECRIAGTDMPHLLLGA